MARGQNGNEPISEAELRAEENSLKAQLAARPKVKLIIPDDPNNPGDVVPIGWNGIIYSVPRGIEFEVPDVIAEHWNLHYIQTRAANQKMNMVTRNKSLEVFG